MSEIERKQSGLVSCLPSAALFRLSDYLNTEDVKLIRQVSKQWKEEAEELCRTINPLNLDEELIEVVGSSCVENFIGKRCQEIEPQDFKALAQFQNLKMVDFSNTQLTDDQLKCIIDTVPQITYLKISGCSKLTPATLQYVQNLKNLIKLKAQNTAIVSNKSILALQELIQLREIFLSAQTLHLETQNLMKATSNLNKLEIFVFKKCDILDDEVMKPIIINNVESLKTIDVSGCKNITDETIKNLSENFSTSKLEQLSLYNCEITPIGMQKMSNMQNLHTLKIGGVLGGKEFLQPLAKLKNLTRLSLTRFEFFDISSNEFVNNCLPENLSYLSLEKSRFSGLNIDEVIEQLSKQKGLNLRQLNVKSSGLTNQGLVYLQQVKLLEEVDISDNFSVEDFEDWNLTNLRLLNVRNCYKITQKTIANLKDKLPSLIEIDVTRCDIEDSKIQNLKLQGVKVYSAEDL